MRKFLIAALLPIAAHAAPFVELGLGKVDGSGCIMNNNGKCSEGTLGFAAVGYEWRITNNLSITPMVEHISSINTTTDQGVNFFSVKGRWTFGE